MNNVTLKFVKTHARSGFTLIEVVLAFLVLTMSAVSLLSLQTNLMRGTLRTHSLLSRLALIKNMFVHADQGKWYIKDAPQEQKIDEPPSVLTYSHRPLKEFSNVLIEKTNAAWAGILGKKNQESLISLRFAPKVKES